IEMRIDGDPLEHALVDFRYRDLHAIAFVVRISRVRQRGYAPWSVTVVAAQPVAGIVDAAVLVLGRSGASEGVGIRPGGFLQGEATASCFGQHPGERHMGE